MTANTGGSQVNPVLEQMAAQIGRAKALEQKELNRKLSPSENRAILAQQEKRLYIEQHKLGLIQQFCIKLRALQPPNFGDPLPGWMSDEQIRESVDIKVTNFLNQSNDPIKAVDALWTQLR